MNATDLFFQPSRTFHSSESFWTSFFALYLLMQSHQNLPLKIPAFQCDLENKCFLHDGELVIRRPLLLSEIVVEGNVSPEFVKNISSIPNNIMNIKPDILINYDNNIVIIETKTIGYSLKKYQKECYDELVNVINSYDYSVEMYYLLSAGHESNNDFNLLSIANNHSSNFKILLWEEVLNQMCVKNNRFPILDCMRDLSKYFRDEYISW